jgi:arylformamidase
VVAVGERETDEFRRQSRDFHAAWRAAGLEGSFLEPAAKNHFTVLDELELPGSELHQALVRLAHTRG